MIYNVESIQAAGCVPDRTADYWQKKMAEALRSDEVRGKSLVTQELDKLESSIGELDASVKELLARIAPVCQPGALQSGECAQDGASGNIEATPSDIRRNLIQLRLKVEAISRQIAPVKYRIEI